MYFIYVNDDDIDRLIFFFIVYDNCTVLKENEF